MGSQRVFSQTKGRGVWGPCPAPRKMIWWWVGCAHTIMTTIMTTTNTTMTTTNTTMTTTNTTTNEKDYGYILEKIWNNEMDDLVDVDVNHDFLEYVATANKYWDNECNHLIFADEEAVVWYLNKKCPDVFCEEFMETFFDVEEEIPDYDYRDWKANPKFLLFASYINSCGGIDEWNWYRVFSGIMMDRDELFSCSDWLTWELKRKPHMDYWRQC